MAQISRTWWGQRFLAALEKCGDRGRLQRGRSYARSNKVKCLEIEDGKIFAQVRGSINPYFNVYTEPLYDIHIELSPITPEQWSTVIARLTSKASLISRLLLNEMPDSIEEPFQALGLQLLPHDFSAVYTQCSCPDWGDPCKHIAGIFYRLALQLDQDPFLLFELRGLSRESLTTELAKSSLGQALTAELQAEVRSPLARESYYTRPQLTSASLDNLRDFWQGDEPLPTTISPPQQPLIAAILIKKMGDDPAFWQRSHSFVAVMADLYDRVRTKNKDCL
ncbi:SWIM zinc finger family protein [Spirulina major]|uniref:SWIM zinc finger family protein n=1 Tax=Spirulina major TaxID=270636 RepID=UPI000934DC76|nr:SWIM zinc finger family protein [Spirulina major]